MKLDFEYEHLFDAYDDGIFYFLDEVPKCASNGDVAYCM